MENDHATSSIGEALSARVCKYTIGSWLIMLGLLHELYPRARRRDIAEPD